MRAELDNDILETFVIVPMLWREFFLRFRMNERGGVIFTYVNALGKTDDWIFVDQ